VQAHARLGPVLESACQALTITPAQLRRELEEGDLQDLTCGALTPNGLRVGVETLALMRYPYPPLTKR